MSFPEVELGLVCRIVPGFAFKGKDLGDEGVQVLKIGNISDDRSVDMSTAQRLPGTLIKERHKKFFLTDKDIVVAMTGATAGKVGRLRTEEDVLLNQRVAKIEAEKINPEFLWIILSSSKYRNTFFHLAGGAAQPNMSGKQIEKVSIPLPDVSTQNQIASILATYDNLIENNRRRIALLEEAARQLYKEWFVRFRYPGHEHVPIVDGVPEGWFETKVGEAVKRHSPGKLFNQKTVSPEGKVPVLDQGSSGVIGYHEEEPSCMASLDDPIIVFANHTCNQKVVHYPFSAIQNVLPFKSSPNLERDLYWLHYATLGLVKTNAYKGHWPEFAAKTIFVPSCNLSEEFGELAQKNHWLMHSLEQQNFKLAKARDLLLPKLMNGEIMV